MYYKGKGVLQNTSQALRWLHKAQVQGYNTAKQTIELIMQEIRETRASQQTNNSSMLLGEVPTSDAPLLYFPQSVVPSQSRPKNYASENLTRMLICVGWRC